MYRLGLPFPDSSLLMTPQWSGLSQGVQFTLLGLVVLIPLVLILFLYRYELKLVTGGVAASLLVLRLFTLGLILFLLCLQPVYARDRLIEIPGRVLVFVDRSASMDIADEQRSPAEKLRLAKALKLHEGLASDADIDRWIEDYEKERSPRWLSAEEAQSDDANLERKRKSAHDDLLARMDKFTRSEIALRMLDSPGSNVLQSLRDRHETELLGFHREVWELPAGSTLADLFTKKEAKPEEEKKPMAPKEQPKDEEANLLELLGKADADAFTNLRLPLTSSQDRAGPGKGEILGVVVVTDGQHNAGDSPIRKAYELGRRGIPVYPVAMGSRKPPKDLAVTTVKASNTVFKGVEVPVEVNFRITGLPEQDVVVELLKLEGEEKLLEEQIIHHDGKTRNYHHRFQVKMDEEGTQALIARVKPTLPETKETRDDNNSWPVVINVADDKAKVLMIDGEVRWEFHYLGTALLRDRTMELDRVVFHQPRLNDKLTSEQLDQIASPREKLPQGPDSLADYDAIILGDVDEKNLPYEDRVRLEQYVSERGGTLVLLAGKRGMPLNYPELGPDGNPDPLRKLMPVEDVRVAKSDDGYQVTLTTDGRSTRFMQMDADDQKDAERWSKLPFHYWGVVGKAKQGATTLAYVPDPFTEDEKDTLIADEKAKKSALFALHNYGFGRVLFVGLDSTWRWRYKTGDKYHHRFWGQAIRWAAAEKPLVTGNEYIRFGAPRPVYTREDAIDLIVRFNEAAGDLKPDLLAAARVVKSGTDEALALVPLARRPAQPRVFQGEVRDLPPGKYDIELVIPEMEDKLLDPASLPGAVNEGDKTKTMRAQFTVIPSTSQEMLDLETRWPLLEEIANKSGGKVFTAVNANELAELLTQKSVQEPEHHEQRLWQWWVFLVVVLALLTVEWVARKWAGLP